MSNFCSWSWILPFHMCFGIRILRPFHLATQIVSIQNLNYPKNAKNAAKTWFLECSSIIILQCKTSLFIFLYNASFHWKMFFHLTFWMIFICITCPYWIHHETVIVQLLYWSPICRVPTAQTSLYKSGGPANAFLSLSFLFFFETPFRK